MTRKYRYEIRVKHSTMPKCTSVFRTNSPRQFRVIKRGLTQKKTPFIGVVQQY